MQKWNADKPWFFGGPLGLDLYCVALSWEGFMKISILIAVFAAYAFCLYVDMDPCPRIPLRPNESQYFLINLSQASSACNGTVSFSNLPAGLTSQPVSQNFSLSAGNTQLLVFKITSTMWAETCLVRPVVTVSGGEAIDFPGSLVTQIMRDSTYYEPIYGIGTRSLKNDPLDANGLLAYYSCTSGMPQISRAAYM
jgi:hypothetical protein